MISRRMRKVSFSCSMMSEFPHSRNHATTHPCIPAFGLCWLWLSCTLLTLLTLYSKWRSHSFERACLDSTSIGWSTATPAHLLSLVQSAPDSSRMRYGRLIVHLVASTIAPLNSETAKQALLEVLHACLVSTKEEPYADKLKRAVFASEWIRKSLLSSFGVEYRASKSANEHEANGLCLYDIEEIADEHLSELDGIVLSLDDESPAERDITGQYTQAIADVFAADRKNRELPVVRGNRFIHSFLFAYSMVARLLASETPKR
jgi:hypothetical protein